MTNSALPYDPFVRGKYPVGVRTCELVDAERGRTFPCEVWYPAAAQHVGHDLAAETQDVFAVRGRDSNRCQTAVRDAASEPGTYPLVVFSHFSGGHRRSSSFLCTHLSSHGYIVAALDHSEVVAPELLRKASESEGETAARTTAMIGSRVPDVRFLLDRLLERPMLGPDCKVDRAAIGIAGHSFGGWTALCAAGTDERISSVVALAPGGASNPKPGILPLSLSFGWSHQIPALYLVAENDISLPLSGMDELFARAPEPKQMVILRRADHLHFIDNVEEEHEAVRAMVFPPVLAWINQEMCPIGELSSGEQAHTFVRGLTLCHFDATLKGSAPAGHLLKGDLVGVLRSRGIDAMVKRISDPR